MEQTLKLIDSNVNKNALRGLNDVHSAYEWKYKRVKFDNGTVDYVMTKINAKIKKDDQHTDMQSYSMQGKTVTTSSKVLPPVELEAKKEENLERAIRRARKAIHYACRQISADHMVTLTTRELIDDRKEFLSLFTKFIRLVRTTTLHNGKLSKRHLKNDYQYVAVPELQDRGAYHIHMAVYGKQDIKHLNACWYVALGGHETDKGEAVKGAVNVQYRLHRFSKSETPKFKTFGIVRYMTKYISKSFEQDKELGQHRYSVARKIAKPETNKGVVTACFSNQGQGFTEAMTEIINKAENDGIMPDFQIWNRGDDVFILRGVLNG